MNIFSRPLRDHQGNFLTGVDKKVSERLKPYIVPALCSWSDLLGFGKVFTDSDWHPSSDGWRKVTERLVQAQDVVARNLHTDEFCLVLNDGIIRSFLFEKFSGISMLSIWFRSIILTHEHVYRFEKQKGLPGMRTIIAAGERVIHNFEDIYFDDLVFNYTKKDPNEMSNVAKMLGNPQIMSNPSPLQMNTAFSKCYLIDDGGSRAGLHRGANIFIDQSVIGLIEYLAGKFDSCAQPIWNEHQSHIHFALPVNSSHMYHIGFDLEKPVIQFNYKGLKTKVYKLIAFYPHDEDPRTFKWTINQHV
jgi:hypothetical protein